MPNRGLGFSALKYLTGRRDESFRRLGPPRILFNYLGHLDVGGVGESSLRLSQLPTGPDVLNKPERRIPSGDFIT